MPLFLYPLIGFVFVVFFRHPILAANHTVYRVAAYEQDQEFLTNYLGPGEKILENEQGFERKPGEGTVRPEEPHQQFLPDVEVAFSESPERLVRIGRADVAVRIQRIQTTGNEGGADPRFPTKLGLEITYVEDSQSGIAATRYLLRLCSAANERELVRRLRRLKDPLPLPPVSTAVKKLPTLQGGRNSPLAALLPLVLVLMTMTGAVYPAIDLTAGERERGTLEILMASPTPRFSLLIGKYVAVLTVALLTALMNLSVMFVTLLVLGLGLELMHSDVKLLPLLLQVLALVILFAAFFSAVLLTVTSVARSFKEAQAYLIPLMILSMMPAILSLLPGLHLNGFTCFVPLLNIVLLARDILDGNSQAFTAILVVGITIGYALLALAMAAWIFGKSSIS